MNKTSLAVLAVAVAAGLAITARHWLGSGAHIDVQLPSSFSAEALAGKAVFDKNCRTCHGENASGTDKGPPLIHKIYEPGHHADRSFHLAVKKGAKSHHWPYGNMAPVSGVSAKEVDRVVAYVRELQRANGIF